MTPTSEEHAAAFRLKAEERLKTRAAEDDDPLCPVETQRLLHELQVHQIELEMQNEELQSAHQKASDALTRYTDLYDFAPVGYFTLERSGLITQVNLTGAILLRLDRSQILDRLLGVFVCESDLPEFNDFLARVFTSSSSHGCQVELGGSAKSPLIAEIKGVLSADGKSCRAIVTDITERKVLEKELALHRTRLDDLVAERTESLRKALGLMADRELRMIALKQDIRTLCNQLLDAGISPAVEDNLSDG